MKRLTPVTIYDLPIQWPDVAVERCNHDHHQDRDKEYDDGQWSGDETPRNPPQSTAILSHIRLKRSEPPSTVAGVAEAQLGT